MPVVISVVQETAKKLRLCVGEVGLGEGITLDGVAAKPSLRGNIQVEIRLLVGASHVMHGRVPGSRTSVCNGLGSKKDLVHLKNRKETEDSACLELNQ